MSRFFAMVLTISSMVLFTACSSTTKKDNNSKVGEVDSDPNISSEKMSFDPSGSDSGKIEGLNTVHFEYDHSTLTSEAKKKLATNAQWIKNNTKVSIQIEGHCDSRGSLEYNLALGERRAKAVKNYLVSIGVDSKRLSIISYGKQKLLALGDTEEDHATNRRANFVPLSQ